MEENILDDIWSDYYSSITTDKSPILNNDKHCKNCNSDSEKFIVTFGDITCKNCGFIQESSIISDDPEWNNYKDESSIIKNSGTRCGNVLDYTNPYDTGNTFIPKFHWSWHLENGIKRYTNLSKIAIRASYTSKQRAFDEGKYSFEKI